jgi:hypothetical protein
LSNSTFTEIAGCLLMSLGLSVTPNILLCLNFYQKSDSSLIVVIIYHVTSICSTNHRTKLAWYLCVLLR